MKVFVLIDLDAQKKDCVEGVYADENHAIQAKSVLNEMRVGGASCKILIYDLLYYSESESKNKKTICHNCGEECTPIIMAKVCDQCYYEL